MRGIRGIGNDAYFEWLVKLTGCQNHTRLLRMLFGIPFSSRFVMDGNRAEDGIYLRVMYQEQHHAKAMPELDEHTCSMLEFLIALADRTNHVASYVEDPQYWFEYFLANMSLLGYSDDATWDRDDVENHVHILLDRRYNRDGTNGGLFTVKYPKHDFRIIEYWWQMQFWAEELFG